MSTTRQQRVGRMLREELSRIIRVEMNDPRLGFTSITEVAVSPDLHTAHVYVSVYGTPEEQNETIAALEHARGYLRSTLGREVNMRFTPELVFHLDRSIERAAHVFELLKEVESTESKGESSEQ